MKKLLLSLYLLSANSSFTSNSQSLIQNLDSSNSFNEEKSVLITQTSMGYLHKNDDDNLLFAYQSHSSAALAVSAGDFVFMFSLDRTISLRAIAKIINIIARPFDKESQNVVFYFVKCHDECQGDIKKTRNELKKIFPNIIIKIGNANSELSLGIDNKGNFFLFPAYNLLKKIFKVRNKNMLEMKINELTGERLVDAYYKNKDQTISTYNKNIKTHFMNKIPSISFNIAPSWWLKNCYPVYDKEQCKKYCEHCNKFLHKTSTCIYCSDRCHRAASLLKFFQLVFE